MGPAEQKVKVQELAEYVYELILLFEKDSEVKSGEPYQLLGPLFSEQCELADSDSGQEPSCRIRMKKKTEGEILQSPYDPDASYGHKGTGYSVHITETCHNPDHPDIVSKH